MLEVFVSGNIFPLSSAVLVCASLLMIYFLISRRKSYPHLPPGPSPYPIIGNILDIRGKDLLTYFNECRLKYGDVFTVKILHKVFIVFNGYSVINEAFVSNAQLFSERPGLPLLSYFKGKGIILSNGEQWKHNRRFSLKTLRDFGMGRNILQVKIHEEIRVLLEEIEKYEGKIFDIQTLLNSAVANIICSMLFGKRYSYDNVEFQQFIKNTGDIVSYRNLFVAPLWSRYIPGDPLGLRKILRLMRETNVFFKKMIREHTETYDENNASDFTYAFIKEMMKNTHSENVDPAMDEDTLHKIIKDLFGAGSETTTTVIKWGIVHLLRDRNLQTQLHDELQENVPSTRLPAVSDKQKLPHLEATILEILRFGSIAPLGVPHAAVKDCTFRGYTIPQDAIIFPNLYSALNDQTTWKNPEKFLPSRFLTKENSLNKFEEFIPFSTGRRICLGESMARMELFLFFSSLVQRFDFLPPEGEEPPTLDTVLGVTRAPRSFKMRAVKRQHTHTT